MAKVDVLSVENKKVGEVEFADTVLSYEVKPYLIHEAVLMQLACRRAGTHSTKTRGEVTGSSRKPWKQKGTGRARSGSVKSPLWRGGGVAFGPHPRDYSYTMPKKKVKNALRSAIRAKMDDGVVRVLDTLTVANGKTKEAAAILKAFGVDRKVLIVFNEVDDKVIRAFANIPYVDLLHVNGLNVYDVVNAGSIFFLQDSLKRVEEVLA